MSGFYRDGLIMFFIVNTIFGGKFTSMYYGYVHLLFVGLTSFRVRALILYVAAGALADAFAALRDARQPDTAAMFLLACHEIYTQISSNSETSVETYEDMEEKQRFQLPSRNLDDDDIKAVSEFFGEYQRKLVHLCMDAIPIFD